jgi:hypothetical protein
MTDLYPAQQDIAPSLSFAARGNFPPLLPEGCFPSYFSTSCLGAAGRGEKFSRRFTDKNFSFRLGFHWVSAFVAIL